MMPISQAQERIKEAFSQQAIVKVNVWRRSFTHDRTPTVMIAVQIIPASQAVDLKPATLNQ